MERLCFLSLLKEIQTARLYESWFNIPGKQKQSSVALVMRVSPAYSKSVELNSDLFSLVEPFSAPSPQKSIIPFKQLEKVLDSHSTIQFQSMFIQRAIDPADLHSGQLAFPGGHVDGDENDFQASVREVQEEIGLTLEGHSLYLGKLPKNFYARRTRKGEKLYTSLHMFLYVSPSPTINLKLQEKEVRDAQWIEMSKIFQATRESVQIYKFAGSFNLNMVPKILRGQAKNAAHYFKHGEFCSIEIGMQNVLWGLTFYFFVYILSLIKATYIQGSESQDLEQINNILEKSSLYNLVFDENYSLAKVINFFTRRVYREQRVNQFLYKTPRQLEQQSKQKLLCISLATLVAAGAIAYPFFQSSL